MILEKAMDMKQYMTNARRHIHENPELGLNEYKTTEFIKNELNAMGIEIQDIGMETGVIGLVNGEKDGSNVCTALRADIDALPICEKTNIPYESKTEGIMHACGHDGHTAVLLGTAKLLNDMKSEFSGVVKLIFQPGEEGAGGAKLMVKKGALENPVPHTILALHCGSSAKIGTIEIGKGDSSASADSFSVRIIGKGGHGARPHESINPINCAVTAISSIETIVSNEISALERAVITITTFHGGTASNVIPDDVKFTGTVRCLNDKNRDIIKEKIERIVKGICLSQNCTYEFSYKFGVHVVTNDDDVVDDILMAARQVLGNENAILTTNPTMGSEDFSEFSKVIPKSGYLRLGILEEGINKVDVHNDRFNYNDNASPYGAAVFVNYILNKHNTEK